MVRAAKTRAGTLAAGLSPTSAPLSREDRNNMALRDLLKGIVAESIEEMANSENDNINNEGAADANTANDETKGNEQSGEAGTKESSTLNSDDEVEFKAELKKLIKKEVRDVAGEMLNRQPSKSQPKNEVDVDAVFANLLGFSTEKKG